MRRLTTGLLLLGLGLLSLGPAHGQKPDALTPEARKAVAAGLDYLARNQAADGSWGTDAQRGNFAIVGLAGRALLASGDKRYDAHVAKAVEFVLDNARVDVAGLLARSEGHGPMYEHAFAVEFLAEAHGKTADKERKGRIKEALGRAVQVIVDAQNREGGWRYRPAPGDADVSVTSCQLHALAAARAAGLDVPQATIDRGVKYVLACQDLLGGDGGFHYMKPFGPTAFPRSAAAVSALRVVGHRGDKEALAQGTAYLRSFKPPGSAELHYSYAHYHAARALRVAGGKDWADWYPAVRDELLERRKGDHWPDATISTHYSTAVALLVLQMPRRIEGRDR